MLGGLFSRGARHGVVTFGGVDGGVGMVKLALENGLPPVLEVCDVEPLAGAADAEQEREALGRLHRRHRISRATCHLLLSPRDYSLILIPAPEVPKEEMRAAVRWRVQELIDFHIDDATIDYFDVPGDEDQGARPMVYVVAARTSEVEAQASSLVAAGLTPEVIDIRELAQRNLAAVLPESASGVALVQLQQARGLITVVRQSILYLARRLDFGYSAFGVEVEERRDGMDRLVVEVQRSLDYFESHFKLAPIRNLALAPTAVPIDDLTEHLENSLRVSTRALEMGQVIEIADGVEPAHAAQCFALVGGALRGQLAGVAA